MMPEMALNHKGSSMKIKALLLMSLLTTLAHGSEVNELSERISTAFKTELQDLPANEYNISFMGQFTYRLTQEGQPLGIPVFLSALAPHKWPEDFSSCETDKLSAVCDMAQYSMNWYQESGPVVRGNLDIKAIIFPKCEKEFPCPLLMSRSISVLLK